MMSEAMAAEMPRLKMLREAALHSPGVQDWVGGWWGQLKTDDRRVLLALSDLDDSIQNAARSWRQFRQDDRDALVTECKRVGRLVEGLRWA
jgi:hypothetical protein